MNLFLLFFLFIILKIII